MNRDLIKLLPDEQELAKLSAKLNTTLTNREQLLSQIGMLDLDKMELEEKMVYVLGLVSLGFDQTRARKRLGIYNSHFYIWKQEQKHESMLESAVARGEMVLEEKVLVEAQNNPRMAFELLKEKQRAQERKEDKEIEHRRNVWDIMQDSAKERGMVQEAQIIDEVLK